jgi:putative ABC transport system ATP-binding protein
MFFNKNKKGTSQNEIKVDFLRDASSGGFQKDLRPSSEHRPKKKNISEGSFWHAFKKIDEKEVSIKPKVEPVKEQPISVSQKKETPTPSIGQLGDIKKPKKKDKKSFWSSLLGSPKKKDVKKDKVNDKVRESGLGQVPKIKKEPVKPIEQKKEIIAPPLKRIESPKIKLIEQKKKKEKKSFWSSLLGSPRKKENDPHKDKIESIVKNLKEEVSIKPKVEPVKEQPISVSQKKETPTPSIGQLGDIKKPKKKDKKSFWSSLLGSPKKKDVKKEVPKIKKEPVKPIEQKKEIIAPPLKRIESPKIKLIEQKKKKEKKSFWSSLLGSPKKKDVKKEVPKIKKEPVKTIEQKKTTPTSSIKLVSGKQGRDFSVPEKGKKEKKSFWGKLSKEKKIDNKKPKTVEELKEEIKEEEKEKKKPFLKRLFGKREKLKKQPLAKEGELQPIIETKNVSVTYNLGKANELQALKNASVKIYSGEYVIMFGPSGCGKSTLLFALTGLQSVSNGDVFVDGLEVSKLSQRSDKMVEFHRSKIGIIFQAFYLIPSLNVFKNVGLPSIFTGESKKSRSKRIQGLLDRFGIAEQSKKLPSQLSGGQKQRAAIARSLVNDPKILFADEPVGNLDSASADTVLNILKELNEKEGRTIILVTHDARHLNFANRVFHIKDGIIIRETVNKDIRPSSVKVEEEKKRPDISEELDLLLRTYSGLSSAQLGGMLIPYKAKQLVQDVLIGMSSEQIKNIEKIVEEYLMNAHTGDYKMIEKTLDQSLDEGGAGLDSRTAENLTEKIQGVLEEVKNIEKQESKGQGDRQISEKPEKIQHLRRFLLEKYNIHIKDEESLKRLDEVIELRLQNKLDSYRMRKTLDRSIAKGGVGLDRRNAKKLAKEMELIMLLRFK